jgi:hypothetical protein
MGATLSICCPCLDQSRPDEFELSSFVNVSSTVKGDGVAVTDDTVVGNANGGCAVSENLLLQTRSYFEITIVTQGEIQVGVTADITKDLGLPLAQREKTWSCNVSSYPVGTVIGIAFDLSSVRPTLSFTANGKAIPQATVNRASGEVYPIFFGRNASFTANFGRQPFRHVPQGFEGLMCSVDLL